MPPKFRLFAGPNGSGKTSLFNDLRKNGFIHTELYVNADRFERDLKENLHFNFNAYRVKVSQESFLDHVKNSSLYKEKIKNQHFIEQISIRSGILKFDLPKSEVNSYHASFVASYLVERLFETNQSSLKKSFLIFRAKEYSEQTYTRYR